MAQFKTVDEVVDQVAQEMQEHFDIILRHVKDPNFVDSKSPEHCDTWKNLRELRDRAFTVKDIMKG